MRKRVTVFLLCYAFLSTICNASSITAIEKGKQLVLDKEKGNCIACHQIKGGVSAGDIGPPLFAIKARFPDRNIIRQQIWDATAINPSSRMPPFGRYKILNNFEIKLIIDYLYTL